MTQERWQQIESIVDQALDLPVVERKAYLDTACAEDPELRTQVDEMLKNCETAGDDFLEVPAPGAREALMDTLNQAPAEILPEGTQLGPYRVIRRIGHGGMGAVYLAEREDFKKRVALKVVKRGMDTEEILQRFRSERQILAALDHPNMAQLLDGGMTDEGLPFFVMEYIEGIPIDEYCDRHKLGITDRLKLFRNVCDAVQYAHQNLIVHRDLKPSNILVTNDGQVKLLDFGIAKVLNPNLSAAEVAVTREDVRLMTPEYASPEQILGQPITTASDVYSLGVILYELLTGHRPYHLRADSKVDMEKAILQAEPTRPSTAITRIEKFSGDNGQTSAITPQIVSAARGTQTERLRRHLRGDLDNIVMMALRKEPARRYPSAEHLSEDVRRYMNGLPVEAAPDSFGYRAQKFMQRHRYGVLASFLILASLIGGLGAALWQARIAQEERDIARLEAEKAEQVTEFVVSVFAVSNPSESRGQSITAQEILDRGAARIDAELSDQPEVQAKLMDVMGRVYQSLGLYRAAGPLLERALAERRALYGDQHREVATSLHNLALWHYVQGEYDAAEALLREAQGITLPPSQAHNLLRANIAHTLGLVLHAESNYDEAEPLYQEALGIREGIYGEESREVATSLNNLGRLNQEQGDYDEAERLFRQALQLRRDLLGEDHPETALSLNNLAALLRTMGDLDAAEPLYREALALRRRLLGDEHPSVANSMNSLAMLLRDKGDYSAAGQVLQENLDLLSRNLGEDHIYVAFTLVNIGGVLLREENYEEAATYYQRGLDLLRSKLDPGNPRVASALVGLGQALVGRGQARRALPLLQEALEIRQEKLGAEDWRTGEAQSILGSILLNFRRFDEAEPMVVQGYETIVRVRGAEDLETQAALERVIALYEAWGNETEANRYRTQRAG